MSLRDFLSESDVLDATSVYLAYRAAKAVFDWEAQYGSIEECERVSKQRHRRRQNRDKFLEKEKDGREAIEATEAATRERLRSHFAAGPQTEAAVARQGGDEDAAAAEGEEEVAVDVEGPPPPEPAARAAPERASAKGKRKKPTTATASAKASARAGGARRTSAAATATVTAARTPTAASGGGSGSGSGSGKKARGTRGSASVQGKAVRRTKKAKRTPVEEEDTAIEPFATFPIALSFHDDSDDEERRLMQACADAMTERVLRAYDSGRNKGVLCYFAIVLHLVPMTMRQKLAEELLVRERQQAALALRLRSPAARRKTSMTGEEGEGEQQEGADAEVSEKATQEEEEEDGMEDNNVDSGNANGSNGTDGADVDLSDYNDELSRMQMSIVRLAAAAAEDRIPMSVVVNFLDVHIASLMDLSMQPRELAQEYLTQREQQLQQFRAGWVNTLASLANVVKEAAERQAVTRGAPNAATHAPHDDEGGTAGNATQPARTVRRGPGRKGPKAKGPSKGSGTETAASRAEEARIAALYEPTPESVVDEMVQELRETPLPWTQTKFAAMINAYEAEEDARKRREAKRRKDKAQKALTKRARAATGKATASATARARKPATAGAPSRGKAANSSPATTTTTTTAVAAGETDDALKSGGADDAAAARAEEKDSLVEAFVPDVGISIFSDGPLRRIAPYVIPREVGRFLRWTLADVTELAMEEDAESEARENGNTTTDGEEGPLFAAAAEETPASDEPADPFAGVLTFLHNVHGVVPLRFCNPFSFNCFEITSIGAYACDCCNMTDIVVGFEAFVLEHVSDNRNFSLDDETWGYNVCLPCAVHVYRSATLRLARALHPDVAVRRGFEHGFGSRLHVRSLSVYSTEGDVAVAVKIEAGVAPYAARPVAWVVPPDALAEMARAFPAPDFGYSLELTDHRRRVLPAPPTPFTAFQAPTATVSSISTLYTTEGDNERPQDCPVCLQPLSGEGPALRTTCGHWFHLACISAFDGGGGDSEERRAEIPARPLPASHGCPICRAPDFMPKLEEADVLARNVYCLTLHLPTDTADGHHYLNADGELAVAIATLISPDGQYHNPTNVAACQLFLVKPKPLTGPPTRGPPAAATAASQAVGTPPARPPTRGAGPTQK